MIPIWWVKRLARVRTNNFISLISSYFNLKIPYRVRLIGEEQREKKNCYHLSQ